ncbi:MAG: hypothetical protein IKY59_07420 [Oscillospiraceae bacterium]|nr:hypothetical protein [Oscillospiraceae bacterium]
MTKQTDAPTLLECPDKTTVAAGIFYALLSLFVVPYYLRLMMIMDDWEPVAISWYEFAYHLINFIAVVLLFREFLWDAFIMFRLQARDILAEIKFAAIGIVVTVGALYVLAGVWEDTEWLALAAWCALPMSETEWLFFSGDLVYYNPLGGGICAIVLAPVTISCLYYCVGFVPAFNRRPWLGYVTIAGMIACVHIRNSINVSTPATELVAFAAQLPIHLLACRAFRKADNIFAPILTLSLANLLAAGRIFLLLLGGN